MQLAESVHIAGWRASLALDFAPRGAGTWDMIRDAWQPTFDVDLETREGRAGGELLVREPATGLPLAQRCFLF